MYEISTNHDRDDNVTYCTIGRWSKDKDIWVVVCDFVAPAAAKRLAAHLNSGKSLKTFAWE